MGKISYRSAWEEDFLCIKESDKDGHAFCQLCKANFQIDKSGLSQVKGHVIVIFLKKSC